MATTTEPTIEVRPACPKACAECPWRIANQGKKPDPHKFYTKGNLARLWNRLRQGDRMSCHPTDPRMAEWSGYEDQGDRTTANECTGSLVVVQREFMRFQMLATELRDAGDPVNPIRAYRNGRARLTLTRQGIIEIINRGLIVLPGEVPMARPDLGDTEVGYPILDGSVPVPL